MQRRHRAGIGLCVWALGALALAGAARAEGVAATVDEIGAKFVDKKRTVGLAIAVARGGELLVEKGYGMSNIETESAVTPDTVFRIGSVTKQFTGAAIVQLMDAGKFAIDDSITTILTEYPEPPKKITVHNLLQHTSGIPSFTGLASYLPNMPNDVTHVEMIARFDQLPLEFDPGTEWRYNNSGYYLLGMIIERASGQTYAEYIETRLFAQAGMSMTEYETASTLRAEGYRRNGDTFAVAGPLSMTQPFAAGALVSTAGDLVRWQRALVDGKLEPADIFARITTDTVETPQEGERYGYGIGVSERDGRRVISHGGGINGFSSLLAYFPESDYTFVVLANTEGFDGGAVLQQLVRALLPSE